MKIGILGTGIVGSVIGSKLIHLGHEIKMGSRTANNEKAKAWVLVNGTNATQGTFAEAAAFGEIIFNCTGGSVSLEALQAAGTENLNGKTLIDLANPLNLSNGMPPSLIANLSNTTSLAEEIQKEFPGLKVVKTLNTINYNVMVNPSSVPGAHDIFICGNDEEAKTKVKKILLSFGWESPVDLGDLTAARGMEMLLPIWMRLSALLHTSKFNFKIVK